MMPGTMRASTSTHGILTVNIITPTIGRKVWFRPNGLKSTNAGPIEVFDEVQALDATIVCVWGDRMVNLRVTDHGGRVHSIRSCTLRQEGDTVPTGYYCDWMPYQKGWAAAVAVPGRHAEAELEKAIKSAGADKAPRLTPEHIEAQIVKAHFHVPPGTCLTLCVLTLRNGFTVLGESACASPENFNAEIGMRLARENARNKIWQLEGYLLRERLYSTGHPPRLA